MIKTSHFHFLNSSTTVWSEDTHPTIKNNKSTQKSSNNRQIAYS